MSKRVLVVAEVGSVHDGSFGNAKHLIDVAVSCRADAIKFQTHIASAETLRDAPMPPYFRGEPRYEYFERTAFTSNQWQELKDHCDESGIEFLSSAFSIEAVELLESVGVARYKIPSGEVTNLPLLEVIAQTGKPILLSSGMSAWAELDDAVNTILPHHDRLTLLQCTSEYPCPYEEVGLNVMVEMHERYRLPVGLSDHTLTAYASLAAVVLGASVIEKHLTFSRCMYGSDARHSLEPNEFTELVQGIRAVETMLSSPVEKDASAARLKGMKEIFEKSVVSLTDIPAGAVITVEMVGVKKPGTGIPARRLPEIVGRRAARRIAEDRLILEDDLVEDHHARQQGRTSKI
ncbi:MAG: N-acetylneuraminate synthase family protein [Acidobacteria bacterium]|nr:N-acetylneuraminate synthase family protein [Acidobacteriota bacterium]